MTRSLRSRSHETTSAMMQTGSITMTATTCPAIGLATMPMMIAATERQAHVLV